MVPFEREFLAACHVEAHERAVQVGQESVPCVNCSREYGWQVQEGIYLICGDSVT